jgi:DNA invertase Pin-like site-specific DNA recombinase
VTQLPPDGIIRGVRARDHVRERQREGVAQARAEGKYKGRAPTAQRKAAEVVQLRGQGGEA